MGTYRNLLKTKARAYRVQIKSLRKQRANFEMADHFAQWWREGDTTREAVVTAHSSYSPTTLYNSRTPTGDHIHSRIDVDIRLGKEDRLDREPILFAESLLERAPIGGNYVFTMSGSTPCIVFPAVGIRLYINIGESLHCKEVTTSIIMEVEASKYVCD